MRERRVRLGAVLRAQAEQHDAGPGSCRSTPPRRGRPSTPRPSASPTRRRSCSGSARRRSSRWDAKPSTIAEERAVDVEAVRLGRHAVADRVAVVSTSSRRIAPGAKCWSRVSPFFRFRTGIGSSLDRQVAGVAHRDERAAVGDELLQVLEAVLADAAAVLGTDRRRVEAVEDVARILVGEDDRVELLAQLAGADVGVVDRRAG